MTHTAATPPADAPCTDAPRTPALPRHVDLVPAALTWVQAGASTALFVAVGRLLDAARTGAAPSAGVLGVLVACAALVAGAAYGASAVGLRAVGGREAQRRDVLVQQMFRLGLPWRTGEASGRFVSTATDGVERAAAYEATFRVPIVASMTVPLVALAGLALGVDPVTAAVLLAGVPAVPLLVGGFQMAFRGVSTRYRATARRFAGQFLDAVQGLPTATAFGAAEAKGEQLARAAEQLRRLVMSLLVRNQLVLFVIDSAFSLAMVTAAAVVALWRLGAGAITPGGAVAVMLVSTVLLEPLDRVGQFFYVGMGGRASVREIEAVLARRPQVADPPGAAAVVAPRAPGATATADAPGAPEALALDGVTFAYGDGPTVLDSVSLQVPVGGRVALIGPSGSGKSTVAALVQVHARPDAGTVRVLGHDVATVPQAWVRSQLAVVAQSTYLFTGTLADNLRLARPDADDDELWHVLDRAALADDVRGFADGLSTRVGERGLTLSGGQAQRLAVARALLKDAPLLVLDEPTSQVDAAGEAALVQALDRAVQGRSVLVVAHRLSTVRDVDEVVVLAGGRVVEQGPPAALADLDSYYAQALDLSTGGAR